MGIYTSNRFVGEAYDYAAEIQANEAYDAAFGCAHIFADCQANDMALFESAIYSDMAEVMSLQEGVQVVNENAFTDVIKKIVEMFKKLLAKIKGIFNAFLAKLAGAFKNGKALVKQYEKQIIKYSNWKDFKVKGIRKPRSGKDNIKAAIYGNPSAAFDFKITEAYQINLNQNNKKADADDAYAPTIGGTRYTTSKIKDMDTEDLKLALLKTYVNSGINVSDFKDLSEEVSDFLYESEETFGDDEKTTSSTFTSAWIKGVLMDEKWESEVKKTNDNLDKIINKIIDDLNKTDDNLTTFIQKNGEGTKARFKGSNDGGWQFNNQTAAITKDTKAGNSKAADFEANVTSGGKNTSNLEASEIQKCIQACQKVASNEQEVITKVTAEYMSQVKFAMAQARKLWAAAAAWSSTTHKESVEYYQALGEAAAEQFYMNMESIG